MSDETPDPLPSWLSDQVDAFARDEAEAVAEAWRRIARHVPPEVVEALPADVLVGVGPQRGAFRFLDEATGATVAEVRDRPEDGATTVMTADEVRLYRLGALVEVLRLPRSGPPDDSSMN